MVEIAGRAWLARGLYYLLPNFAPFDVKTRSSTAAGRGRRTSRCTLAICGSSTSARCCSRRRRSSRGGTSSDDVPTRQSVGARPLAAVARAGLLARRSRPGGARSRLAALRTRDDRCCTLQSRSAAEAARRSASTRCSPTSTGFARFSHYGGRRPVGRRARDYELLHPLLDLDDHARSAFQHRLPVRRDLPVRGVSRRARPARSGDRLLERGIAANPNAVGVSCTTSASSTTGALHDYQAAADWFERASRAAGRARSGCRRWRPPRWRRAATGSRRGMLWQQIIDDRDSDWLRRNARAAPARSSTRWIRSTSSNGARERYAARRAAAGDLGRAGARRACCAACRSIRRARPTSSMPATGHVDAVAELAALAAADDRPTAVPVSRRTDRPGAVAAGSSRAWLRRQLPQRLHLPPAARRVDRAARLALHGVRPRARWYDNIPVLSWRRCWAAAAARCRAPISDAVPARRAGRPALRLRAGAWLTRPGPAAVQRG